MRTVIEERSMSCKNIGDFTYIHQTQMMYDGEDVIFYTYFSEFHGPPSEKLTRTDNGSRRSGFLTN